MKSRVGRGDPTTKTRKSSYSSVREWELSKDEKDYLELERIIADLKLENGKLKEENSRFKELAYMDYNTGIYNRRMMEEKLNEIVKDNRFTLFFVDMDGLKQIDDTKGHSVGAKLVKETASVLAEAIKDNGFACSWGGDEFVLITFDSEEEKVLELEKRFSEELERRRISVSYGKSTSLEFTHLQDPEQIVRETLDLADMRMYEMKRVHHRDNRRSVR